MIFVSHRQVDEKRAILIYDYLRSYGIKAYVDVLDPNLSRPIDITKRIISQLEKCSHIIAVFSVNTKGSMWVPFELGAAYEGAKGIGTFLFENPEIPEYLKSFPLMRSNADLDVFIEEYKNDYHIGGKIVTEGAMNSSARGATTFIEKVKSRLSNQS